MEILLPLQALAPDLRKVYPRSPRETLAGYVIAARVLDKCRASLAGCAGEYRFNTGVEGVPSLDSVFFDFTGIDPEAFAEFVATGATDDEVAAWIEQLARSRPPQEVVQWNDYLCNLRLSDAPSEVQMFMKDYIAQNLPKDRAVHYIFDVFDIEEGRL